MLADVLESGRQLADAALERLLASPDQEPVSIHRAMRHSVFAGGKRLRPILSMEAARMVAGALPAGADELAAALEMLHTYSLIHDDLPALDNDDLRRGRATSHRVFGEAMAILAGDALLTHAFEVAALHPRAARHAERTVRAMGVLARAAGVTGMIGGQVMDLEAEGRRCSVAGLVRIHAGKTGALIRAAAEIGGIMAGADEPSLQALGTYGSGVGLAFQIVDDILDLEGSSDRLGKTAGKDLRDRKATFPALLGVAASRRRAEKAAGEAIEAIRSLGQAGRPLVAIARFIVRRSS